MISRDSQRQLKDMVKVKHTLSTTADHLNELRRQMGEGWRKVAGTLLGEAYDQKIEGQLRQSASLREGLATSHEAKEGREESAWEELTSSVRLLIKRRCLYARPSG